MSWKDILDSQREREFLLDDVMETQHPKEIRYSIEKVKKLDNGREKQNIQLLELEKYEWNKVLCSYNVYFKFGRETVNGKAYVYFNRFYFENCDDKNDKTTIFFSSLISYSIHYNEYDREIKAGKISIIIKSDNLKDGDKGRDRANENYRITVKAIQEFHDSFRTNKQTLSTRGTERAKEYNEIKRRLYSKIESRGSMIINNQIELTSEIEDVVLNAWLSFDDKNLYFANSSPVEMMDDGIFRDITLDNYDELLQIYLYTVNAINNYKSSNSICEKIPFNKIIYYREKGEKTINQEILGGGVNLKAAALANLFLGPADAIVASRIGTDIRTREVVNDSRFLEVRYYNKDKKLITINLPYEAFSVLDRIIPEKEYSFIQFNKQNTKTNKVDNEDPIEKIKELKGLLDIGAITQEEFDEKKKKLLDAI